MVLTPKPITVFSGLPMGLNQCDTSAVAITSAGVLSKFLPVLLAKVTFHSLETFTAYVATA